MKPTESFSIWFSSRTGSIVFCQGLEAIRLAGKQGKFFTLFEFHSLCEKYQVKTYLALKNRLWEEGTSGNGVFGIKIVKDQKVFVVYTENENASFMIHLKKVLLVLLLFTGMIGFGQSFIQDSKNHIFPFNEINDKILINHIGKIADSTRVIGLGEVTHYTKECYELKHQIINKLMEKGFHALILEVDFGQALLWNEYVTKGIGDIDQLIAESGWFTYRTQEFKNLLLDIRSYNLQADQPFQVFGMEMTAMNYNLTWLSKYFSSHLDPNSELVAQLNKERTIVAFQPHTKTEVLSYWELYFMLQDSLVANQKFLIEKGGEASFEIAKQITEITRQYATYVAQDEFLLKVEFRDQFSTRNVFWCLDRLGENSKVAIWAHNGHIAKESILFSYDILGYYLSKWIGAQYYAIGFTFNEGEFGAFSSNGFQKWQLPPVTEPSLTMELDAYESPFLLFDIQAYLKETNTRVNPLNREMPIRTDISESYSKDNDQMMTINLAKSYDCLLYIDRTHYPTTIKWER